MQATPNYIISYRAINPSREWEDGVFLSPVEDVRETMEREGYRKLTISSVKVNK